MNREINNNEEYFNIAKNRIEYAKVQNDRK